MRQIQGKWIVFNEVEIKPKTSVWGIVTNDGIPLGQIKWFAQWRKYSFFPNADTVFEKTCLMEIVNFIEKLMNDRKKIGFEEMPKGLIHQGGVHSKPLTERPGRPLPERNTI